MNSSHIIKWKTHEIPEVIRMIQCIIQKPCQTFTHTPEFLLVY